MNILSLVVKEILHRKFSFALGVAATLIATASVIGAIVLLRTHDLRTAAILHAKEAELLERMDKLQDDTRKSMLKLGFNLVILPEDQNLADWYANDYSTKYMPESYAERLAESDIVSIRHILPSLQQKIPWPERKRTIILVGTRGEVPNAHLSPQKPMVQPVPSGNVILGYELHRSMDIGTGDRIRIMGKTFTVRDCYSERGNKDDITAWIDLKEAQELLGKPGRINAILALECLCTGNSLPAIREEVAAILPGTQVIEQESRAVARAEARTQVALEAQTTLQQEQQAREILRGERERMAQALVPVVFLACALWIALTGYGNVRSRREEIGILRAMGVSAKRIFMLFIWKHVFIGVPGGILGLVAGGAAGLLMAGGGADIPVDFFSPLSFWLAMAALAVAGATLLAVVAGWLPAMIASGQDPAEVLREE
ncbi:MAG: ABC transporter permease [Acidobacteria bacterium]|nr:ABC transporter permease [Acidobacteriota bacterium]